MPYGTTYGQTAIGVGAASEMFFDKPADKLDLAQCALLAGLPQAPSDVQPVPVPEACALAPRAGAAGDGAIGLHLRGHGQGHAGAAPAGRAQRHLRGRPPALRVRLRQAAAGQGPGRSGVVDRGGLKVYTTINLADQQAAAKAIQENESHPGDPASALVSINPDNGHILALQNSTVYGTGKGQTVFDYATQAQRQTGSSFKTFVLMTLIHDQDGNPNDTYYNSHYLAPGWLPGYPTYSVHTAEDSYQGDISVTRATALSDNTVYAQLGVDLGINNVNVIAHEMGITARLTDNPSEAIGGLKYGVSALQMSDAYATLANGGDHVAPDDHLEGRAAQRQDRELRQPDQDDRVHFR